MDLDRYRYFEKKDWIGLGIACFFGLMLWIHLAVNLLLQRNAWFDWFFGFLEIIAGGFLIVLGYFQSELIDWLGKW